MGTKRLIKLGRQGRSMGNMRGCEYNHWWLVNLSYGFFFILFSEHSNGSNIASLFRVIGSRRVNHFTLVVLHGACINSSDPHCKLLSLYPVKSCRKFSFQSGKLHKRKLGEEDEKNFEEGVGRFCSIDFPEAFNSWEQAICSDSVVKKFVSQSRNKLNYPNYHCNSLVVAYTKKRHCKKLKEISFGAALAQTSQDQDQEKQIRLLEKYHTRAANLNGSLLSMISRRGNPKNVGVVLAINDTLGPHGACLPNLPAAMRRVIAFFVMAVVVAGLPDGEINVFMLSITLYYAMLSLLRTVENTLYLFGSRGGLAKGDSLWSKLHVN